MGKSLIIKGADFHLVALDQIIISGAPVISITSSGSVSITCDNASAIYYTTDGSTPTSSSTQYTSAFVVQNGTTVKAVGVVNGELTAITTNTYIHVEDEGYLQANLLVDGSIGKEAGFSTMVSILKRPVSSGSTITFSCSPDPTYKGNSQNYVKIGEYNGSTWIQRQHQSFNSGTATFTLDSNTTAIIVGIQSGAGGVGVMYPLADLKTLLANASLTGTSDDTLYGSFDPDNYEEYNS